MYTPNEAVDKQENKVWEGRGQNTAEALAGTPGKYAVNWIVLHGVEGDTFQDVARWYGYTSGDDIVEPLNTSPNNLSLDNGDD